MYKPKNGVFLTTYQCTAACPECCFECAPDYKGTEKLTYEEMVSFIDQISEEFGVKQVIWSGGECFLLGEELKRGIQYAKDKGMVSRCVTNGYWATSEEVAHNKLRELKEIGLTELNLSTGDNHQLFVPEENILNAVIAGAKLGLRVAVSVETRKNAKVSKETFESNLRYKNEIVATGLEELVHILPAVWVSYHEDTIYEYEEDSEDYIGYKGCDTLFESLCLTPHRTIVGCCGLSIEYIPEMTLGKFGESLTELYQNQYSDFLKVWLYVDGPKKILEQVKQWDESIKIPSFMHICQACAYIYQTTKIQSTIQKYYRERYDEVIQRFLALQELDNPNVL